MKSQFSKNDRLDSIVGGLLKVSALTSDETEQIADGGELFASVRARIIADRVTQRKTRGSFTVFQQTAIVSAAAAIIVVAVFGAMSIARRPLPPGIAKSVPPVVRQSRTVFEPPLPDSGPTVSEFTESTVSSAPHFERAIAYRPAPEHRQFSRPPEQRYQEPAPEFYALADLHPSEEVVTGGRIVRVELPRASLVALGVNLPLDSDKQSFKTDLLVGPDGVPRAIRLVE
jgi:hypothetical protein